jgi:drug/metabolite transporter (DMT)-like permease
MVLIILGIKLAGSALFTVSFSWITVFAAFWKKIFLGKDQTCYQWIAIAILTFGLCYNAIGAKGEFGDEVLQGVLASVGAAVVYSVYYIFCDVLGNLPDAPSPEALAAFDGLTGTCLISIYILVVDGPRWEEWVSNTDGRSMLRVNKVIHLYTFSTHSLYIHSLHILRTYILYIFSLHIHSLHILYTFSNSRLPFPALLESYQQGVNPHGQRGR